MKKYASIDGEIGDSFITYPYFDEKTIDDFLKFLHTDMPLLSDVELSTLR